jgi:two-component system CheB/CheR fusion protein
MPTASAVAIILSGTGADGTLGLRRVKEAGGFTIAQDPAEAEYDGMPRNAIDTGLVDLVLPVAEIPGRLRSLSDDAARLILPAEEEVEQIPEQMDFGQVLEILHLLRLRTGHDFSQYKRPTLLRRIARRLQVHQVPNLTAYLSFLEDHPDEIAALLRDLLITVSNFFRDHEAFEALEQEVVPRLFAGKRGGDSVRVWAVGCATGEEAYSLAMLLSEHAERIADPSIIQIFATDIDEAAIAQARKGRYPNTIALDVSAERLRRFFIREGDSYRVKKEIRELVLFTAHNVLRDPPFSKLDLVSCRNLLIYLNQAMQDQVLATFHFALLPEGHLFLGSSESTEGVRSLFFPSDKKHRIYARRAAVAPFRAILPSARVGGQDAKPAELPIPSVRVASSTFSRNSRLTVVSSSLRDCSSSLLVSSSSAVERSSSLIACSSSFEAFNSSVEVSYCSMVRCS